MRHTHAVVCKQRVQHTLHTIHASSCTQAVEEEDERIPLVASESPRALGSEVIKQRLKEMEESARAWKE